MRRKLLALLLALALVCPAASAYDQIPLEWFTSEWAEIAVGSEMIDGVVYFYFLCGNDVSFVVENAAVYGFYSNGQVYVEHYDTIAEWETNVFTKGIHYVNCPIPPDCVGVGLIVSGTDENGHWQEIVAFYDNMPSPTNSNNNFHL